MDNKKFKDKTKTARKRKSEDDQIPNEEIQRMPITKSEPFIASEAKKRKVTTEDMAVNTCDNTADNLAELVSTLRKIVMIAEELDKRNAKILKEIIDSIQEDLKNMIEDCRNNKKCEVGIGNTLRR